MFKTYFSNLKKYQMILEEKEKTREAFLKYKMHSKVDSFVKIESVKHYKHFSFGKHMQLKSTMQYFREKEGEKERRKKIGMKSLKQIEI